MQRLRSRFSLSAVSIFVLGIGYDLAGCLELNAEGLRCGPGDRCPSPYRCNSDKTCTLSTGGVGGRGGGGGDQSGGGSAGSDAGADQTASPGLYISSPTSPAYTNGMLSIQVVVSPPGALLSAVQLEKDGSPLASIAAPYGYVWDTAGETEGAHQITASGTVDGVPLKSNTVTVTVDRTPPAITGRVPVPNATNVFLADEVEVLFSEELNPASIPTSAITLAPTGAPAIGTTATLDGDGKTIRVRRSAQETVALPSTIVASALPTITDLAGNTVGSVGPWSWSAPAWVTMPDLPGPGSLALEGDGRPFVSFTNPSLSTPSSSTSVGAFAPVAADGTGAPAVSWSEGNTVYVGRWNGSTWDVLPGLGDPQSYLGTNVISKTGKQLRYDAAGYPIVGFDGHSSANQGLAYVGRWSGTAWSLLTPPDLPLGRTLWWLELDHLDVPYAMTLANSAAIKKWSSAGWDNIDLSMLPFPWLGRTFALDQQDRPAAISHNVEGGVEVIRVHYWSSSAWNTWTAPLKTASENVIGSSQLLIDSRGNPLVLWNQADALNNPTPAHLSRSLAAGWDEPYGPLPGPATAVVLDGRDVPTAIADTVVYRSNH